MTSAGGANVAELATVNDHIGWELAVLSPPIPPDLPPGPPKSLAPLGLARAGQVRPADGVIGVDAIDLASAGFGTPWGHGRVWASDPSYALYGSRNANGNGWVTTDLPRLIEVGDSVLAVVGTDVLEFEPDGSGGYRPRFFVLDQLTRDPAQGTYELARTDGSRVTFSDFSGSLEARRGQFDRLTDPAGHVTLVAARNGNGEITDVQRSATVGAATVVESYRYDWTADGSRISAVTLRRGPAVDQLAEVRRVEYTYYAAGEPFGTPGDLKTAVVRDPTGVIDTSYYRYYTSGTKGGLRYAVGPAAFARLRAAVPGGTDAAVFAAPDAQVAPFADLALEYDPQGRVSRRVVAGAGASAGTGQGAFTYRYARSRHPDGFNSWRTRTDVTLPDGGRTSTYSNAFGEVMLESVRTPTVVSVVGGEVAHEWNGTETVPSYYIFTRSDWADSLTVSYSMSGSATAGGDYVLSSSGSVTFPAGESTVSVTITPLRDSVVNENTETAWLSITPGEYAVDPAAGSGVVWIVDGPSLNRVNLVSVGDGTPAATESEFTHDRLDRALTSTDSGGAVTKSFIDAVGRTVGVTEGYGVSDKARSVSTGYDVLGRTVSVTDPRDPAITTDFQYDDILRTVTTFDPLNNKTVAAFDAAGNRVSVSDPLGKNWTFTPDLLGRVTAAADPLGKSVQYRHNVTGDRMVTIDRRGYQTQAVADRFGRMASVIDPESESATFGYDRAGRVTLATDARGTPTKFEYDALGRTRKVTEAPGFPEERYTESLYDAEGDLVSVTDPRLYQTVYTHDEAGRVKTVTAAAGKTEEYVTEYGYDSTGRVEFVTLPGDRVTKNVYTLFGQLQERIDAYGATLQRSTQYEYDKAGNQTKVTDPLGHATAYGYDKLNRLETVTDPMDGVTTRGYDDAGRLEWLEDPVGNLTEWRYDDAGHMTQEIDPLLNVTTYVPDANGNFVTITDRLGRRREFQYDGLNRVTVEDWYTAAQTKVQTRTFGYDENGNLISAADSAGAYTLTHDKLNRAKTVAQPYGLSLAFEYDGNGNRTQVTDSRGGVTVSGFDGLNRLTSRELGGAGVASMKAVWAYDPADEDLQTFQRYGWTGTAWALAAETVYDFDDLGRVTTMHLRDGSGGTISFDEYVYDDADRVTFRRLNGVETSFSYYANNELKTDGGTLHTYDENGNRTDPGYVLGDGNRLTSDGVWTNTYDDAGQVVKRSKGTSADTWEYQYDHAGRMTQATYSATDGGAVAKTVEYTYDVLGNRLQRHAAENGKSAVTERFAYDGWDTARPQAKGSESFDAYLDLDGAGNATMRRVFGSGFDEAVGRQDSGGVVSWYGMDRQGSVRKVFDNAGVVTGSAEYAGFGAVTVTAGALDRYQYTGREWDQTLELQYSRARVYDPKSGRFLSEDSMRFAAGDPNLFRYAGNNPTNASDPSGLQGAPLAVVETSQQRRDRLASEVRDLQRRIDDFSGQSSFGYGEILRGLRSELSARQTALDDLTRTLRIVDAMLDGLDRPARGGGPTWDVEAHAAGLRLLGVPHEEARRTAEGFGREYDYHVAIVIAGLNSHVPVLIEKGLLAAEAVGYVGAFAGGAAMSLTGYGAVAGVPLMAWSGDQMQAMVLSPLDGPRNQTYTSQGIAGVAGYVNPTLTPRERYAWGEAGNIVLGAGLSAGAAGPGQLLTRQASLASRAATPVVVVDEIAVARPAVVVYSAPRAGVLLAEAPGEEVIDAIRNVPTHYAPRPGNAGHAVTQGHMEGVRRVLEGRGWQVTGAGVPDFPRSGFRDRTPDREKTELQSTSRPPRRLVEGHALSASRRSTHTRMA